MIYFCKYNSGLPSGIFDPVISEIMIRFHTPITMLQLLQTVHKQTELYLNAAHGTFHFQVNQAAEPAPFAVQGDLHAPPGEPDF